MNAPERIYINSAGSFWYHTGAGLGLIEYIRSDIHKRELREMASFIIGAMNYGRIWNPDEALTAFLKSKEKP